MRAGAEMMLSYRCRDIGMDCKFIAEAETQAELLEKIAEHAEKVHGLKEIPNELMVKVKAAIRS
ncbi:MAG: hypothetical protein A3K67_00940 [Euryarchaeota archaeon RBG_16_62_10]|nr:MAG: hypothetical protein A3K67_00940 [Euryarchaeota archaeon RBG_16_62_10]